MKFMNQDLVVVLSDYSKGLMTLDSFRGWLGENVWELSNSESPLDRMILGELELALGEYDRGDRNELYIRDRTKFLLKLPNPEFVPNLRELTPMMSERQVTQTGKDADGNIIALGNPGQPWSPRSKNDAINDIESGQHTYFVSSVPGNRVGIHVVEGPTGKYLRTVEDTTEHINLDELPDCLLHCLG